MGMVRGVYDHRIGVKPALNEHFSTEQVAQGQYVVSDTRCPALHDCELE